LEKLYEEILQEKCQLEAEIIVLYGVKEVEKIVIL